MFDAVVLGLGAMVGAGVFSVFGPAAEAAGPAMLLGLLVAASVAYCNATSSAQLAAVYPQAGGTYVYGRERLGRFWGTLAGWCFVFGKTASLTAMALTIGSYLAPRWERPLAVVSVAGMTFINYVGIAKTASSTKLIVGFVIAVLLCSVVVALTRQPSLGSFDPFFSGEGAVGVLRSAGLLFFAFAGYARIATLGEEVRDPERTIPRAIPVALAIVVCLYGIVATTALAAIGPGSLAASRTPLVSVVSASGFSSFAPVVRVGAAVASLGVLLSLLAGVSRTILAMARDRAVPTWFARVHAKYRTPSRGELAIGLLVGVLVLLVDLRIAIGFSSFTVLVYYAIANVSAWTQPPAQRRWPRWLQAFGAVGCLALVFALPPETVLAGGAVTATAAVVAAITIRSVDA
ncbi:MAG TPA: APC family permease [Actinomycetota bacterium]|nr:APC family permease [Actinomycetota bacterium]